MSKRILVVEDQEDLRAILRDFLSASGYTVIEAIDGAQSVAKAASERPMSTIGCGPWRALPRFRASRQASVDHIRPVWRRAAIRKSAARNRAFRTTGAARSFERGTTPALIWIVEGTDIEIDDLGAPIRSVGNWRSAVGTKASRRLAASRRRTCELPEGATASKIDLVTPKV
jgi:CheY-like chemotaxis protein